MYKHQSWSICESYVIYLSFVCCIMLGYFYICKSHKEVCNNLYGILYVF